MVTVITDMDLYRNGLPDGPKHDTYRTYPTQYNEYKDVTTVSHTYGGP